MANKVRPTVNNIKKEYLQLLKDQQFTKEPPVYEEKDMICFVPQGSYSVTSRLVPAQGASKAWTAWEATFEIKGVPYTLRYKSGIVPDSDGDMVVLLFEANRTFTCSNGTVIPMGKQAAFCMNA